MEEDEERVILRKISNDGICNCDPKCNGKSRVLYHGRTEAGKKQLERMKEKARKNPVNLNSLRKKAKRNDND